MKLAEYTSSTRAKISGRIEQELQVFSSECKGRGKELDYVFPSLSSYALSGKMLRGVLVCLGSSLFNPSTKASDEALDIAAAMELFQSGLLVHDDIMDKDDTRRGHPTMHRLFEQYETNGVKEHNYSASSGLNSAASKNPKGESSTGCGLQAEELAHLGESLAICAGDICYFIAWKLITKHSPEIGALVSRELVDVCLAQMRDVRVGCFSTFPSLEEILDVYAFKTARYTITMPLCCGVLLEKHAEAIPLINDLGLNLGILFQLQDDYLGLFGNENEIGKPVGSDLKEGKKTPFMILLQPKLTSEESTRFKKVFGNKSLTLEDMNFVRKLIRSYGVDSEVRILSNAYAEKAKAALSALEISLTSTSTETLSLLREFIDYSLARTF